MARPFSADDRQFLGEDSASEDQHARRGEPLMPRTSLARRGIDLRGSLPPRSVLWTPIPVLSWIVPFVGHLCITTSKGAVFDLGGSYCVHTHPELTIFGRPTRYKTVSDDSYREVADEGWDQAIYSTAARWEDKSYNLFTRNCHHFVADALNEMGLRDKKFTVVGLVLEYVFKMKRLKKGRK